MSLHDKPAAPQGLGADAVRHLGARGRPASRVELDAVNLLFMAADGHSRPRKFVLGGATGYIPAEPSTSALTSR
ncbi:hypothetical protein [Phenylobacterium sp.]|uniref:hypothetical protein n=1 Tax=Phenylobacterium sp. TaxID=1871053 RepID=UPI002FCAD36E